MNKYFVYDPQNGFDVFDTLEEAKKEASEAIESYLDGVWNEEVKHIKMGIITHEVQKTNIEKMPDNLDEDGIDDNGFCWTGEFDYKCDYEMLPNPIC